MKPQKLSEEELRILSDPNHYRVRASAYAKFHTWLQACKTQIQPHAGRFTAHFPDWKWQLNGKISRGENYRNFPWRVLDLPAVFDKKDIFLFRIMVLGGHHLSLHLILSGKMKAHFAPALREYFSELQNWEWSRQDSPWEWEFNENTHRRFPPSEENPFLKISKKLKISAYESFPDFALQGWKEIERVLLQEAGN